MSSKESSLQPDIIFFITEFSFFKSHRLNLIKFLSKRYHRILILTHIKAEEIDELNNLNLPKEVVIENFFVDRSSIGLTKNLIYLFRLFKVLSEKRPKSLFLVSSKPIILGGICSLLLPIKKVFFNISGLGYLFISQDFKVKIIRVLILIIYKIIFMNKRSKVIFQNRDDLNYFTDKNVINPSRAEIIRGNGVDSNFFIREERPEKITFLFASRLLIDKGITEYINAISSIHDNDVDFKIAGRHDKQNPNCIDISELNKLKENPLVSYLGFVEYEKMPQLFNSSDVFVLPSYREGLPKVALEAACSEMPLILTDVNGCRDCLIEGETGFLVRSKDHEELRNKMIYFINNKEKISSMGKKSRLFVESNFSEEVMFPKYDLLFKQ